MSHVEASADEDQDGFSNLEEAIVGTDALNPHDLPRINMSSAADNRIGIEFDTVFGKHYQLLHSTDLLAFNEIGPVWLGDGHTRFLEMDLGGRATSRSPMRVDFWSNISGTEIGSLYQLDRYPGFPDGRLYVDKFQEVPFKAIDYGARMTGWFTSPESGRYTFYLTAGFPAELYITSVEEGYPQKAAEILPSHSGLSHEDWDVFATQVSVPMDLVAGEPFLLDLRYVVGIPGQHIRVAWSGPGTNGIIPISYSDLTPIPYRVSAWDGVVLYQGDFNHPDEGLLWTDSELVMSTQGANRLVQYFDNTTTEKKTLQFSESIQHSTLYATWLFEVEDGGSANINIFNGTFLRTGPTFNISVNDSTLILQANRNDTRLEIPAGKAYRVEIVAAIDPQNEFVYRTPLGQHRVANRTFDVYVSDLSGYIVAAATGMPIASSDLEGLSVLEVRQPQGVAFVDWYFSSGLIDGRGYLISNKKDFDDAHNTHFFRLNTEDKDQDGDGLTDWEELVFSPYLDFLFFDEETIAGAADSAVFAALSEQSIHLPTVALCATDAAAFENNHPNLEHDYGQIRLTREGSYQPLAVKLVVTGLETTGSTATVCDGTCCIMMGSAGDEAAEPEDYQLIDADGTVITDTVHFAFGEMEKRITVKPVNDSMSEYPETLNLAIAESTDGSYAISDNMNGASVQIFDLPDSADNVVIFTGTYSQDGRATVPSSGSGYVTVTLNGPRTHLQIQTEYSGLTSAQMNAHVHKSVPGTPAPLPGAAIYGITNIPGDPLSNPLIIDEADLPLQYPWDLTSSSGALSSVNGMISKQVIIDSLFGQNNESRLYFNIHTMENPGGEIWAFLKLAEDGSIEDPGAPEPAAEPGSSDYPQLAGDLLDTEVRRFLNQATFGATDTAVNELVNAIETARLTNPDYHRHAAFSDWIDTQMAIQQSYLFDYLLADTFQSFVLSEVYPPHLLPETWPHVIRGEDPATPYLSAPFPLDYLDLEGNRLISKVLLFKDVALSQVSEAYDGAETLVVARLTDQGDKNYLIRYIMGRDYVFDTYVSDNPASPDYTTLLQPLLDVLDGQDISWNDDNLSETQIKNILSLVTRISEPPAKPTGDTFLAARLRHAFFQTALNGRDQLRQKMGFALQQIVVVSNRHDTIKQWPLAASNYQDGITHHAFSHFRDILGFANWNPLMAIWLSSLGNQKAIDLNGDGVYDTYPDENLARENMQLFSIGVFQQWPDGTLKLSPEGLPQPSHGNSDITELARILTGFGISQHQTTPFRNLVLNPNAQLDEVSTNKGFAKLYISISRLTDNGPDNILIRMIDDEHGMRDYYFEEGSTQYDYSTTLKELLGRIDALAGPNWDYNLRNDSKSDLIFRKVFELLNVETPTWGGAPFTADNDDFFARPSELANSLISSSYIYPMKMFGEYHSLGVKRFAGAVIDNTHLVDPTEQGIADLEAAIDWLAGKPGDGLPDFDMQHSHVSTPAFISRKLIQRFTTSNPSRQYLHRVATAFKASEGNLGHTIKAILLDPEARRIDLDDNVFGMKKSPLEGYLQLLRTLGAHTHIPMTPPLENTLPYQDLAADFTNPNLYLNNFGYAPEQFYNFERNARFFHSTTWGRFELKARLDMDFFDQESVFNYYLPDFSPDGIVSELGYVAPEMQMLNELSVMRNINYSRRLIHSGIQGDKFVDDGYGRIQNKTFGFKPFQIGSAYDDAANYQDLQLPKTLLAQAFYPADEPAPTETRSGESLADEALLDHLDRRLTNGYLKMAYDYNPATEDSAQNPRESIINALGSISAYDGYRDEDDRIQKFEMALYLLTLTPEYQIRR